MTTAQTPAAHDEAHGPDHVHVYDSGIVEGNARVPRWLVASIVALFAFGARLAQHCGQNGHGDLVFDIATLLAQFAVDRLTPFLKEHGGWVSLACFLTEQIPWK